jgi:hypothetical protein
MPSPRRFRLPVSGRTTPTRQGIAKRSGLVAVGVVAAASVLLAAVPAEAATIKSIVGGTPNGQTVRLGSGTYAWSNFGTDHVGVNVTGKAGLTGAGPSSTVLQMNAHSSTYGHSVPTASGTSNPLYLMAGTGGVKLSNFWLKGTAQGHIYNGIKISRGSSASITNVKITGVPGSGYNPPQETATINDQNGSNDSFSGITEDGQNLAALGFASNSASNVKVSNSSFVNNRYSAGAAFWQTKNITLSKVVSKGNRTGLNFERCSGTITISSPTILNESNQDLYIGSDQGSAKITITNPTYSGHLRIRVPATYRGGANKQHKSDIHVLVNGVDKTSSVVTWL